MGVTIQPPPPARTHRVNLPAEAEANYYRQFAKQATAVVISIKPNSLLKTRGGSGAGPASVSGIRFDKHIIDFWPGWPPGARKLSVAPSSLSARRRRR